MGHEAAYEVYGTLNIGVSIYDVWEDRSLKFRTPEELDALIAKLKLAKLRAWPSTRHEDNDE